MVNITHKSGKGDSEHSASLDDLGSSEDSKQIENCRGLEASTSLQDSELTEECEQWEDCKACEECEACKNCEPSQVCKASEVSNSSENCETSDDSGFLRPITLNLPSFKVSMDCRQTLMKQTIKHARFCTLQPSRSLLGKVMENFKSSAKFLPKKRSNNERRQAQLKTLSPLVVAERKYEIRTNKF